MHRPELEHLDEIVVEPEPILLEEDRPAALELDTKRDDRHQRQCRQKQKNREHVVEQALPQCAPARDRLLGQREHRYTVLAADLVAHQVERLEFRSDTNDRGQRQEGTHDLVHPVGTAPG